MENPIDTLQDRIIYLTGQITLINENSTQEPSVSYAIKEWNKQIEQHKLAISVLEEKQPTSESNLDLNDIRNGFKCESHDLYGTEKCKNKCDNCNSFYK